MSEFQPHSWENKKWHDEHGEKTLRELLAEEQQEADAEDELDMFDSDYQL